MKNWKLPFCSSLFFHVLFLSVFMRIGLGDARSFREPEPIEVELGSPMSATAGSGDGHRTETALETVKSAGREHAATPPSRHKEEAADEKQSLRAAKQSATATMPREAGLAAASGESGAKKSAEALPGPSSTGNVAASGNGAANGRADGAPPVSVKGGNGGSGASDTLPYVIRGPAPPYPPDARSRGLTGRVRVKVLISEQGMVRNAFVAASSGHPSLDEAALNGLRRWLFSPAHKEGRTVAAWVVVPVLFRLD